MMLLLLALGCSGRRGEPIVGPLELTPDEQDGEINFEFYCGQCHPGGEAGLGPPINDKPLPGFLIRMQVRLGFGAMPGFDRAHIPPHDLDDMVAYMKAVRKHRPGDD